MTFLLIASCRSGATGSPRALPVAGPADGASGSPRALPVAGPAEGASNATIALPEGEGGIGFDDLVFAPGIGRVLVPAASTGRLDLVDPDTRQVTSVPGFRRTTGSYRGGHDDGTTSADEGRGLLFAIDRTSGQLDVIDPSARSILASVKLAAGPDYVRWVEATGEIWVTEPGSQTIEVFTLPEGPRPIPVHSLSIKIDGGPESLIIDGTRKRAFTHLWNGFTVAIDVIGHAISARWANGCRRSRGIALDTARGFLFAGCGEGKVVALDVGHDGKELGAATSGEGVDVISYSAALGHVYVPGARSATMAIVGVGTSGQLTVLGTVTTAEGAHCVTADNRGHAWVCDPDRGRLLVFKDSF